MIKNKSLPDDVARLIIAARNVVFSDEAQDMAFGNPDFSLKMDELDEAAEAFADKVPWKDDPNDE